MHVVEVVGVVVDLEGIDISAVMLSRNNYGAIKIRSVIISRYGDSKELMDAVSYQGQ